MKKAIRIIDKKIEKLWSKTYNNQSEASNRANEITRLEKMLVTNKLRNLVD